MIASPLRRLLAATSGLAMVAVAATGIAIAGHAGPAQAHDFLVSSTPAADATLTDLPALFEVTMSEPPLDIGGESAAFALQVLDAEGAYYGDGCVALDGATMSSTPALGAAGAYTVRWQVVSSDGHTVSGEIPFAWAPAVASAPAVGSPTPPACGAAVPPVGAETDASDPPTDVSPSTAPAPAPQSEPAAQSDSLPVVLGIGGAVLAIAAIVVAAVLLTGRRRDASSR